MPIQGSSVVDSKEDEKIDSDQEVTEDTRTARSSRMDTLLENFEKTGTSGAGVDMLKRRGRSPERSKEEPEREESRARSRSQKTSRTRDTKDPQYQAFMSERIAVPTGTNANVRKQMMGKNLKYSKEPPSVQKGLDKSREKEWENGWISMLE